MVVITDSPCQSKRRINRPNEPAVPVASPIFPTTIVIGEVEVKTETEVLPRVALVGASGRSFSFAVFDLRTNFDPNQPAVYVVMRAEAGQYVVIYVGQTQDLVDRFADHHKEACMARYQANCIAAQVVRDEAERLAIENDLITAYNPPCNG